MDSLTLMLAEFVPFEMMVEQLKDVVKEYEANPSEENKARLTAVCFMIATKEAVKQNGGMEKTMEKIESMKAAKNLYDKNSFSNE